MQSIGSIMHWTTLDDNEFEKQLKIKLIEEAHEVINAQNKQELISELADLLQVMDTMAEHYGFCLKDIQSQQQKKYDERGGYKERIFLMVAEHLPGSNAEKYCLADPEKYPEIKD